MYPIHAFMLETWDGISLFVTDVARSRSFYETALGFHFPKPIRDGGTIGFRASLKLGLYDRRWQAALGLPAGPGGASLVFSLRTPDLQASYRRLLPWHPTPPQRQPWGAIAFFLTDPDGYGWEIFQPPT